jgi:predicted RNA-binding Zn-ribbon protein involved in translation (DUF1610 family)
MFDHLPTELLLADCVACGRPIEDEQEAVSTPCGSLHADCFDAHIQQCAICDEDGAYHGDDGNEPDGSAPNAHAPCQP